MLFYSRFETRTALLTVMLMETLTVLILTVLILSVVCGCTFWRPLVNLQSVERSQLSYAQAEQAMADGDRDKAETLVRNALQRNPDSTESKILYAKILWEKGNKKSALAMLQETVNKETASAQVMIELAQMYLQVHDLGSAKRTINLCIMNYPENPQIWNVSAHYYRLRGDMNQTVADLHRSLTLDPDQHSVRLELAQSYLSDNQPQRALETVEYVLSAVSPGDEPMDALLMQGKILFTLQRYRQAEESFAIVLKNNKSNPDIYFYLSCTQLELNHWSEAIQNANKGLQINPDHAGCRDVMYRCSLSAAGRNPER